MATKKSSSSSRSSSSKRSSSSSSSRKSSSSARKSSSSSSSFKKAATKEVVKAAKKNPVGFIIVLIILLCLGVGGFFGYRYYKTKINPDMSFVLNGADAYSISLNSNYVEKGAKATYAGVDISNEIQTAYFKGSAKDPVPSIVTAEEETFYVEYSIQHEKLDKKLTRVIAVSQVASISINFLELGNQFTGDSVYIKAGDADILIDAGSRKSSAKAIKEYLNQPGRVEDGKLEYVVATHAHQDHIAGFVGTDDIPGIFDSYECETIIDFALTNQELKPDDPNLYTQYVNKRDAEVAAGAKHYTAKECRDQLNGASRVYTVAPGITMEILNHKFYHAKTSNENDYSVCLLFTQGENRYLFTGDLEEKGEASLSVCNTLPEVTLFKGAHHGSYTANNDELLHFIKPKVVCICCCAGSTEYTTNPANTFPAQDAITRLGKYTEKIYVTTLGTDDKKGYTSMNGNITCTSLKGEGLSDFAVHGSNNDTILKETAWFKANRTWPSASA